MKHQRRIENLCRRHLRERARGGQHFDRARTALDTAQSLGLAPGVTIILEIADEEAGTLTQRHFSLIDNAEEMKKRGAIYRPAALPRFELKAVPKNPRSKLAEAAGTQASQPVRSAGVSPAEEAA